MKVSVWVAVSAQGHVATFAGFALTRKTLSDIYLRVHGRSLKEDGYRLVKATLEVETP